MKVFLSYTIRDGFISKHLLKIIERKLADSCEIYIDLLHNSSSEPQEEVISQLNDSNIVIQITTPSIEESNWVSLEKKLAEDANIPTYFVDFLHARPNRLVSELLDIIKSYKSSQKDTLTRASA